MILSIYHRTRYDYAPSVATAHHLLHLCPVATHHQRLLSHALRVEPNPTQRHVSVDSFGNQATYVALSSAHDFLDIVATSQVQTISASELAANAQYAAQDSHLWQTEWEAVRACMEYRAGALWNEALPYLFASPMVPIHADFKEYARISFISNTSLLAALEHLMQRIHREFTYESKSTDVNTPVLEALAQKKGVCQDFAHVMLGCCHSVGLAARYVSGYLLTLPPPGQPKLIGADASHAWISVFCPVDAKGSQGVWFDFDPTNNKMGQGTPGEDYVALAYGRDYSDISPVRGVIQGSLDHTLKVEVNVERL